MADDQSINPQGGAAGQQPAAGEPTGGQPQTGQPAGGQPASNLSGIMEENVDVGDLVASAGQNQAASQQFIATVKIPPHPNTKFDEKKFLELLAGSISLTLNEKKNIINAVPQLTQFQIDELMKIFDEEKGKFAELEQKHAEQVAELEKQHAAGAPDALQAKQEEDQRRAKEEADAEAIKKSLGL